MQKKLSPYLSLVAALLLGIGPWTFFPVCPVGEKVMKCHLAAKAIIPLAVILAVVALLQIFSKEAEAFRKLAVVGSVTALMPLCVTSFLIGGCMKAEMSCNVKAFPAINIISLIAVAVQIWAIFYRPQKKA